MAAPGVVSIKTFTYKDAPEEWSNKYHFQGDAPSDPAGWRDLCDALAGLEGLMLADTVTIIRFLCYEDTDDDSVYTYDLTAFDTEVVGSISHPGADPTSLPGNVAYLARWNTGRMSSRGKPVYLFKYFHGGWQSPTDPDKLDAASLAALDTFAEDVGTVQGAWPGLAGPDGAVTVGWLAERYLTTRTLKRRGRRPT